MIFVIPMAGRGRRFVERGFTQPKYLLEAHGKTLLEWSVDSLPLPLARRVVFVALAEHERDFGVSARIRALYAGRVDVEIVLLDRDTRGQAETVLLAEPAFQPEESLAIFNIDTMFRSRSLGAAMQRRNVAGVLGSFRSREPRFSFAALDASGAVTRVTEKDPISEHALTGLYHFARSDDFVRAARSAIAENRLVKGEFYVAPLYNDLLAAGKRLIVDQAEVHHILGTPDEYEAFRRLDPRTLRETTGEAAS